jgi:hypothetical protein
MKDDPKAPAEETPDPKAFERMIELTRRLVAVPKREIADKPRPKKRESR